MTGRATHIRASCSRMTVDARAQLIGLLKQAQIPPTSAQLHALTAGLDTLLQSKNVSGTQVYNLKLALNIAKYATNHLLQATTSINRQQEDVINVLLAQLLCAVLPGICCASFMEDCPMSKEAALVCYQSVKSLLLAKQVDSALQQGLHLLTQLQQAQNTHGLMDVSTAVLVHVIICAGEMEACGGDSTQSYTAKISGLLTVAPALEIIRWEVHYQHTQEPCTSQQSQRFLQMETLASYSS